MNPKQYLKDYYSKSPNDGVLNQLSNFGLEAGGGKAFATGLLNSATDLVRVPANLATAGAGYLSEKLDGKNRDKFVAERQAQINNFFTPEVSEESVKQYPGITSTGNAVGIIGGGILGKAQSVLESPLIPDIAAAANGAIKRSLAQDTYTNIGNNLKNADKSLAGYGKSILNGVGNTASNVVQSTNTGLSNFADNILNTNHSKQTNQLNSKIDKFFKF